MIIIACPADDCDCVLEAFSNVEPDDDGVVLIEWVKITPESQRHMLSR